MSGHAADGSLSARDRRVLELAGMRKSVLVARWKATHPCTWTMHPPERWTKDELIHGILEQEMPR